MIGPICSLLPSLWSESELPLTAASAVELAWSLSLAEVCISPEEYALAALPHWLWQCARRVFIHCGLFAEHKLLLSIPRILAADELPSPHPNLQERFFRIEEAGLISNVIGATRLMQNLTLLRLLGVSREQVEVIIEQTDYSAEYTHTLRGLSGNESIDQLVLTFNRHALADKLQERRGGERRWCSSPLLSAVLLRTPSLRTLIVHLTSVYGRQCVALVDALRRDFDLREVFLLGACGALVPDSGRYDTVFPRLIVDHAGQRLADGNILLPQAAAFPRGLTGEHHSLVVDATSAVSIPSETRDELTGMAAAGVGAVDLESEPLGRYLAKYPNVRWGAALEVSDCPLQPTFRLPVPATAGLSAQTSQRRAAAQAALISDAKSVRPDCTGSMNTLHWEIASGDHPLRVWETIVPDPDGRPITIHALPLNLQRMTLKVAVNPEGQGFNWHDDIVRGMRHWDAQHMESMNRRFRRMLPELASDLVGNSKLLGVINGNGNLFWNLGHFVWASGALSCHYRERFAGAQTALLRDTRGVRLGTVDVEALSDDIEFAVSGTRIIRRGQVVDLLETDPDTGRSTINEFYGDLTHVLRGFRLSLGLARRAFDESAGRGEQGTYCKRASLSPWLRDAVSGLPVSCTLASDDDPAVVRAALGSNGFKEQSPDRGLLPGEYSLHARSTLGVAWSRGTLGHSVLASTDDHASLLLVNTYTDASRKGFTVEDTAALVRRVAQSLGHEVNDAILLASSGDPRIILHRDGQMRCLENNQLGEQLLFKGGLQYGLSSALLVCST